MKLGRDGVTGLIGLVISLVLLPKAFGLPQLPIVPIGPGFYPAIVLVFMAITSAILLVQDMVAQRAVRSTDATPDMIARSATRQRNAYELVLGAFALTGAYVVLLPLLGFRAATALFVAAFQLMMERPTTSRQWGTLAAVAIGTSLVTYVVFERYLLVLLPRGAWTGW